MVEIDAKRTAARIKPDGTVRARAYHGYSRNGCARCKQQRVRCDERHPECDRCVRVGAKCPGYEQKLRWSAKHEVFRGSTPASVTKAGRRTASRFVSVMPAAATAPTALPSQQRSRSLSRSSPQETSPASLSSSSDTIELPAGSAGACPESILLPAEADNAGLAGSHVWDASSLDLLNQMPPPIVADVPDFLLGLDNSFLAGRKSPGMGMFLGGLLPNTNTPAVPAPFVGQAALSEPPLPTQTQQPMPAAFPSLHDPSFDDLWRGMAARRDDMLADVQDMSGSRHGHKQTTAFLDDDADEPLSPFEAEDAYQTAVSSMRSPLPLFTSLNDTSSLLVEFYFKETAQIYSCYDGRMNPFRTAVVNLWTSSEIINCTAQSMAAACLLREFPQIASVGRQLRQEAARILARTKIWDPHTLLAVLMLGGTASWHDSKDLGLQFFQQISERLALAPASVFRQGGTDYSSYRFFYESMQYWEMQLSFLTDSETLPNTPESHLLSDRAYGRYAREEGRVQEEEDEEEEEDEQSEDNATPQLPLPQPRPPPAPHPWTGYATETQRTVQKVGRLIRRQRMFASARRFASAAHIHELQQDMATARALEAHLVAIAHPAADTVRDTEDYNTPVWHLLTLAEIIRHMGLIQLYHVFPDLLSARLRREGIDDALFASPSSRTDMHRRWLTKYALRTVDMVRMLPVESGTRVFQPFLLVALTSELRTEAPPTTAHRGSAQPSARLFNINREALEVARARSFIQSRLRIFLHILPPKPMMVCLDIVRETWRQMDFQAKIRAGPGGPGGPEGSRAWTAAGSEADVYWMDVMIENGWETIMG